MVAPATKTPTAPFQLSVHLLRTYVGRLKQNLEAFNRLNQFSAVSSFDHMRNMAIKLADARSVQEYKGLVPQSQLQEEEKQILLTGKLPDSFFDRNGLYLQKNQITNLIIYLFNLYKEEKPQNVRAICNILLNQLYENSVVHLNYPDGVSINFEDDYPEQTRREVQEAYGRSIKAQSFFIGTKLPVQEAADLFVKLLDKKQTSNALQALGIQINFEDYFGKPSDAVKSDHAQEKTVSAVYGDEEHIDKPFEICTSPVLNFLMGRSEEIAEDYKGNKLTSAHDICNNLLAKALAGEISIDLAAEGIVIIQKATLEAQAHLSEQMDSWIYGFNQLKSAQDS